MLANLVAVMLSQTPAALEKAAPWEVAVGVVAGVRPQSLGIGGVGAVTVTRSLTSWLRLDGLVGTGVYSGPLDHVIVFRVGARLEWPTTGRFRPFLYVAFAHQHEASWRAFTEHTAHVVLSLSKHVHHRSGVDTGVGFSVELPKSKSSALAGRISTRATMLHLMGAGTPRSLDLTVMFGACF